MDPGWLCFHPNPSRPEFELPAMAVDAHCHVFGPAERFPYAESRKYTPCDASKEELFSLRDRLGFERNVIVQATCHGHDNRALVDALTAAGERARGVATVAVDVTDEELLSLDAAGVRGVRFNFLRRLADFTPVSHVTSIAARIGPLGWHVVVYFEAPDLPNLSEALARLPVTVVIDHMGRPDVTQGVDGPDFNRLVALMREHAHIWSKVTCPERISMTGPPDYEDFVPLARTLVEEFPERVLWGTDWPHPNLKSHMPDDGRLVDLIPSIATTKTLQASLLVDNPARLYWSGS